jgi:hypothetical protein
LKETDDCIDMTPEPPEIEELERSAEWRLRRVDAGDTASAAAATILQQLADDLRRNDYPPLWTELRSIGNWLGESDAISDYADLCADYRARIGVTEHPATGADYLGALLAIARGLM